MASTDKLGPENRHHVPGKVVRSKVNPLASTGINGATEQGGSADPGLRIGAVARLCGISAKTIRFYCDQELIAASARTDGGYRLFDQQAIHELQLIKALKNLEMPLSQIKKVLEVRRSGVCNCNNLKHSLGLKVEAINQKISELKHMQDELNRLLDGWQDCGGSKRAQQP